MQDDSRAVERGHDELNGKRVCQHLAVDPLRQEYVYSLEECQPQKEPKEAAKAPVSALWPDLGQGKFSREHSERRIDVVQYEYQDGTLALDSDHQVAKSREFTERP